MQQILDTTLATDKRRRQLGERSRRFNSVSMSTDKVYDTPIVRFACRRDTWHCLQIEEEWIARSLSSQLYFPTHHQGGGGK